VVGIRLPNAAGLDTSSSSDMGTVNADHEAWCDDPATRSGPI